MFTSWLANRAAASRVQQLRSRRFDQRRRQRALQSERLESRQLLAADVIITEFMADNGGSVKDSFGDASDWIEIYNRGDAPQNMSGWYLTDNASALTKWQFPAVTIPPQQSLLVWATSRNLTNPLAELHTNFGLSKGGEFLGLVQPNGTTIVSQFAPKFPAQYTDVSYGLPTTQVTEQLVSHASPTQVLIPTSGSLGTTWTAANFVPDAAWTSGASQAVGYDTAATYVPYIGTNVPAMRNVNGSALIRIPFNASASNFNQLSLRVRYDDGFVAYINGQEVARRNAPANVQWNSTAAADRIDSLAVQYETIDLSAYAGLIHAGDNVLAVHGLNVVPSSSDFLIDTELSASRVAVLTAEPPRFFFLPTPGAPNVAGTLDTRPLVLDVSNTTATDAADVQVKARVVAGGSAVAQVNLHYRVMYGTEVIVAMFDDGLHGDTAANDGIFGGSIPAGASGPGQMVRYYVTAAAVSSAVGRAPLFSNPDTTAQYLGFVIPDPSVASNLAIFQFFVQDPNWFRNANGTINRNVTSASFFFNGKFYDNIHINARGDSSITNAYPNQKFKVDFNDEAKFDYGDGREVTGSFNLDNVYQDPSYARLTLGSQLLRDIGTYAQVTEPVHARMNGAFYSLGIYNERYNGAFLRRNDLGDDGALYESEGLRDSLGYLRPDAGGLSNTLGFEKDNREFEAGFADLQAFINGISPSNPNRERYLFDNVNIPEVVNVIAGYSLLKHYDRDTHNYYVYRDSDGNGEWSLLPYDLDLIWDRLKEPLYATNYFSGHPFEGSSQDPTWAGTHWNRLVDAFADSPTLSQMVLRRLRELMDEFLQPPGTPYAERKLEAQLDALYAKVLPEAQLDTAKWSLNSGGAWGGPWTPGVGVAQLKQAFDLRRNYLYSLNIIPGPQDDNAAIQIYSYDVDPVSGNQNEEYVHLYNPNPFFVDLSGWKLESAVDYTFVKGVVIPAGGSLIVAKDVTAFRARKTGPAGGIGLFIQGDYSGNLSNAGETIVLRRANGTTASSVTYAAITSPPVLGALPNQVLVSGTPSAPISLPASDQDTPTANLTFSGSAQSSLYLLDQQLNLSAPTVTNYPFAYYQNIRGLNEKYLFNPSGVNPINQWYYILPNGNLYLFTGSPASYGSPATLQGAFLTNVGTAVYQNPALLHAAQPASIPVTFQFTTGDNPSLVMTAAANYVGSFVATVTVSDGSKFASRSFQVQVNEPTTAPPVLGPIANQTLTSGVASAAIALAVSDQDTPTADLTFTATAQSSLYLLDQQLNLTAPTVNNYPFAYYQNIRGLNEKYLFNPSGVNPINQWYYILPNGNLYLFTGSPASYGSPATLQGAFLANVGVAVYQNPALLHAAQPVSIPVTFQFTTGDNPTLVITPAANYVGSFVATVTASDGAKSSARTFQVQVNEPTTAPPVLGPIANQALTSGIASAEIPLVVSDADTPTANLTFSATAQSPLYLLDQQLNLTAPTVNSYPYAYYQNIRQMNEKYLFNPSGVNPINQWYYILPSGDLYLFTGNPAAYGSPSTLQGTFLANVGAAVYQNPALLHNAQPGNIPVTFNFTTGANPTLQITPGANFTGSFVVIVTASDGTKVDAESFQVQVSASLVQGESARQAFDTNQDGSVSPIDALLIINAINAGGAQGEASRNQSGIVLDVNGDGVVSPLDAVLIVNYLNRAPEAVIRIDDALQDALARAAAQSALPPIASETSAEAEPNVLLDEVLLAESDRLATAAADALLQAQFFWYQSQESDTEHWTEIGRLARITAEQLGANSDE